MLGRSTRRASRWVEARWWLPAWALLSLVVRLGFVVRGAGVSTFYDENDYDRIAMSLLSGHGFAKWVGTPTAFRPPGQPILLAGIYGVVGHHPMAAQVFQAVLLSAIPFTVARLTGLLSPRRDLMNIAGAIAALHPGLAYASATLYPTTLTAVSLTVGLCLAAEVAARGGPVRAAFAGSALGVAGAATTYFAPMPLCAALVLLLRRRFMCAAVVAGVGLAPALGWSLRDQSALGTASLSTSGGYNLALGANDRATPRSGNWVDPDPLPADIQGEVATDRAFRGAAAAWIKEHPFRYACLAAARAIAVIDSVGRPRTAGVQTSLWASLVGWAMLPGILLGLAGLWAYRREPLAWLVAAALGCVMVSVAATIVKPRFRFPCDPALAGFAVLGAARARARRGASPVTGCTPNRSVT